MIKKFIFLFLKNIFHTVSDRAATKCHKKDGYRQQNVRQPQKLISIIDYDSRSNMAV